MELKGNKSGSGTGKDSAISRRFHPDQIGGLPSGNNGMGAGGREAGRTCAPPEDVKLVRTCAPPEDAKLEPTCAPPEDDEAKATCVPLEDDEAGAHQHATGGRRSWSPAARRQRTTKLEPPARHRTTTRLEPEFVKQRGRRGLTNGEV